MSAAILVDGRALERFAEIFIAHGALGGTASPEPPAAVSSEAERLSVVPLVFWLLPAAAFARATEMTLIKPAIREHLSVLGLDHGDAVVDVLKSIADQYWRTDPSRGRRRPRKRGIADLRAQPVLHSHILGRQQYRCAVCGISFRAGGESLDHMIPWRLVGDIPGGLNWQVLCTLCNLGKRDWLSALQSKEAANWIYRLPVPLEMASPEGRYVTLAVRRTCEVCGVGPDSAELNVMRRHTSGLAVFDNLAVRCSATVCRTATVG